MYNLVTNQNPTLKCGTPAQYMNYVPKRGNTNWHKSFKLSLKGQSALFFTLVLPVECHGNYLNWMYMKNHSHFVCNYQLLKEWRYSYNSQPHGNECSKTIGDDLGLCHQWGLFIMWAACALVDQHVNLYLFITMS